MLSLIPGWLLTIFLLGGLIFIHEFGHFLAAKLTGVKVDEFGFGYPPRLLTLFERGGTKFTLNAIPFGGFVRPAGDDDPTIPGGLASASKRVRTTVLLAGVGANLLTALVVFTIGFKIGWPDQVVVRAVVADAPAAQAGLQVGDVVLRVNGARVHQSADLAEVTYQSLGRPISLLVARGGEQLTLNVTPRTAWPEGQGPMGIEMQVDVVGTYTWFQSAGRSVETIGQQAWLLLTLPARLIQGSISASEARPIGIIGLYDLTTRTVETAQQSSQWVILVQWVGLISTALALGNLLPIPALDGGRLLFVVLEAVRRKRIPPERERAVHAVGFVLILGLMIYISYLDLVRPVIPR
jgi:regulator of sigma E protease